MTYHGISESAQALSLFKANLRLTFSIVYIPPKMLFLSFLACQGRIEPMECIAPYKKTLLLLLLSNSTICTKCMEVVESSKWSKLGLVTLYTKRVLNWAMKTYPSEWKDTTYRSLGIQNNMSMEVWYWLWKQKSMKTTVSKAGWPQLRGWRLWV